MFPVAKPVIGCIHLQALPGSPGYDGDIEAVYRRALNEAATYLRSGVHGLIIENFNDVPFYPDAVQPETIASMTVVTRDIVRLSSVPVGVNVLRNDASAALAIAAATGARFIRINVHMGATVTDQGLLQGQAHRTARLRSALNARVAMFADVAVKHGTPLAQRDLDIEVLDLIERGMADAIIVTGDRTGGMTSLERLERVRKISSIPVIAGSGVTADQLPDLLPLVDGMIVGSVFKEDGRAVNPLSEERVLHFMEQWRSCS